MPVSRIAIPKRREYGTSCDESRTFEFLKTVKNDKNLKPRLFIGVKKHPLRENISIRLYRLLLRSSEHHAIWMMWTQYQHGRSIRQFKLKNRPSARHQQF